MPGEYDKRKWHSYYKRVQKSSWPDPLFEIQWKQPDLFMKRLLGGFKNLLVPTS